MLEDPIVESVRTIRREILESYDWDFEKMSRDMMKKQWESGHKVVSPPPKKRCQDIAQSAYPKSDKT